MTKEELQEKATRLEAEIEDVRIQAALVPGGPSRAANVAAIMANVASLEADLEATQIGLEQLVGPPPKRYSAVGRMRQQMEGMGEPGGVPNEDADGPKVSADQILPSNLNLGNIGITLAIFAPLVFYLGLPAGL